MAAARPDPNVRELRMLALLLEQGPGFPLDLAKFPGDGLLLTRLREHLEANPAPEGKHPAVMVVGLCIGREVNDPSLVDGGTKALTRVRGGA